MTLNFDANYPNVAKISRAALRSNFQIFKRLCGAGVKICPAVKANAYGHGVEIVAPVLAEAGADMFAVANLAEAQELAGIVPAVPILVFSPLQGDSSPRLSGYLGGGTGSGGPRLQPRVRGSVLVHLSHNETTTL